MSLIWFAGATLSAKIVLWQSCGLMSILCDVGNIRSECKLSGRDEVNIYRLLLHLTIGTSSETGRYLQIHLSSCAANPPYYCCYKVLIQVSFHLQF